MREARTLSAHGLHMMTHHRSSSEACKRYSADAVYCTRHATTLREALRRTNSPTRGRSEGGDQLKRNGPPGIDVRREGAHTKTATALNRQHC